MEAGRAGPSKVHMRVGTAMVMPLTQRSHLARSAPPTFAMRGALNVNISPPLMKVPFLRGVLALSTKGAKRDQASHVTSRAGPSL